MLLTYLIPHLYEAKQRPKVEKRGSKVTSIRAKNGIVFRDITKMLAPGTNLRNFGKLFNIHQEKAHFPFSYLTSVEVLKETSLPGIDQLHLWKSDLSSFESNNEIEKKIFEAQKLFSQNKCSSIGEYLKIYLELDVIILYKGIQEWRKALKNIIGIDFIESQNFTISSLANLAVGKSLSSRRHIGLFFPNNSQNYRLLRQGMRG